MNLLTSYLKKMLGRECLTKNDARIALEIIINEHIPEQAAAFLSILKFRGETAQEVLGMLDAVKVSSDCLSLPYPTLDIVGTGGDGANTVNISTGAAILTAACGVPVMKHGNRAVSSQCGSADVLEALGVKINMSKELLIKCVDELNIAFMFAPLFHPALKVTREIRNKMAMPTTLNLLGPLLNPAAAPYRLIGVGRKENLELMSDIIMEMSEIRDAFVYHGCGLDELTSLGTTEGYLISSGKKVAVTVDPISLGFKPCTLAELQGGDKIKNAALLREALSGKSGAIADALVLTSAMALMLVGKTPSLQEGITFARATLESGKAIYLLEKWSAFA